MAVTFRKMPACHGVDGKGRVWSSPEWYCWTCDCGQSLNAADPAAQDRGACAVSGVEHLKACKGVLDCRP